MRTVLLATLLTGVLAGPALADTVELPTPAAAKVQQDDLIASVGGRPDRLLQSDVPGPVVNDEVVRVGLAADGGVQDVTLDQRLQLTGEGDYAVRERGPARSATSLGDEPPPVTRLGGVVWQGFSPGRRDLAARLVLDPVLEAARLPLEVALSFNAEDGTATPLGPGGAVPSAGTVSVTVTNRTSQPQVLPTGTDVAATAVAPLLDRALAVSRRPGPGRLPSTDLGLPATLQVTGAAEVQSAQAVPFRLRGTVRLDGAAATLEGPATTPDGTLDGTLGQSASPPEAPAVTFTLRTQGPGRLLLDLTAVAALNQAELAPPDGSPTWAAWAAAGPDAAARKQALDLLVAVAATGARASSYSPYLGADLAGSGSAVFRYALAPAPTVAVVEQLEPRWGRISLLGLGFLVLLVGAQRAWRRL